MGVSSSLIAAAIVYGITNHKWLPAFVIAAAGIIGFLITHLFARRPAAAPSVHQDIKQEANPQINVSPQQNVYIGTRDDEAERERKERDRHDRIVFEHIKQQHEHRPAMTHLVAGVASAVSLTFHEADQSLKRLFAKDMLYRSTIDAPGDFVYWYRGPV